MSRKVSITLSEDHDIIQKLAIAARLASYSKTFKCSVDGGPACLVTEVGIDYHGYNPDGSPASCELTLTLTTVSEDLKHV